MKKNYIFFILIFFPAHALACSYDQFITQFPNDLEKIAHLTTQDCMAEYTDSGTEACNCLKERNKKVHFKINDKQSKESNRFLNKKYFMHYLARMELSLVGISQEMVGLGSDRHLNKKSLGNKCSITKLDKLKGCSNQAFSDSEMKKIFTEFQTKFVNEIDNFYSNKNKSPALLLSSTKDKNTCNYTQSEISKINNHKNGVDLNIAFQLIKDREDNGKNLFDSLNNLQLSLGYNDEDIALSNKINVLINDLKSSSRSSHLLSDHLLFNLFIYLLHQWNQIY